MLNANDNGLRFDDLSLQEKDLIATIRRLEANFGEDQVQTMVFLGDAEDAENIRSFAITYDQVSRLPYEGVMASLSVKIPEDLLERDAVMNNAFELIRRAFGKPEADLGF